MQVKSIAICSSRALMQVKSIAVCSSRALVQVKSIAVGYGRALMQVKHSAILFTCTKLPLVFKAMFCLFLSGCLREVSLCLIQSMFSQL